MRILEISTSSLSRPEPPDGFTPVGLREELSIPDFRFSNDQASTSATQRRGSAQSRIENPKSKISRASRGFTLIELLAVITIIGILAAILIPLAGRMRESARTSECVSNMRQIGLAMQLYAADNKGGLANAPKPWGEGSDVFWYRDWMRAYAPYVTPNFDYTRDWNLKLFWCPSFIPSSTKPGPQGPPDFAAWQIQNTSYWYGDYAAGTRVAAGQPLAPRLLSDENLSKKHVLREEGYYHGKGSWMNLLYGDGHVSPYKKGASFPPP
ncbi:MAG: DUF1559 domain-containing protein [Opitutaceae bacterium]|jgi:prepilin-type N-terminal cleavage/methylation domain-containing protein/prepilin-type processing-associated H-X9-DG protein|nr:DUF1559 domain-containing protein [Opitutaceae bacterium]